MTEVLISPFARGLKVVPGGGNTAAVVRSNGDIVVSVAVFDSVERAYSYVRQINRAHVEWEMGVGEEQ